LLILAFYSTLSFTGIFAFSDIQDLYTLNFQPNHASCLSGGAVHLPPITTVIFLQYFLALFPVFTIGASFPIIAITLRNNLKILFHRCHSNEYSWTVDKLVFPTSMLIIPTVIAFVTNDLQGLVGITGSYAGAGIQYIVPACFVLLGRRMVLDEFDRLSCENITNAECSLHNREQVKIMANEFVSPFKHVAWVVIVFVWAVICVVLVTANHVIKGV